MLVRPKPCVANLLQFIIKTDRQFNEAAERGTRAVSSCRGIEMALAPSDAASGRADCRCDDAAARWVLPVLPQTKTLIEMPNERGCHAGARRECRA